MQFYAVYRGFKPGIYINIEDVDLQVKNYTNPIFKKYNTLEDAQYFLKNGKGREDKVYTMTSTTDTKKSSSNKSLAQSNILQFFGSNNIIDIEETADTIIQNPIKKKLNINNDITTISPLQQTQSTTTIIIYTDGSCMKRHNNIAGCGVHFPNKEYTDISEKFLHKPITNQRAELYAILLAIRTVTESDIYRNNHIVIHSDSEYSINCITKWCKGWENNKWRRADNSELKNLDIIIPLYELYNKHTIKMIHVRAHCGILGNEIADTLATEAAKR
jgi:ribonuclease HI